MLGMDTRTRIDPRGAASLLLLGSAFLALSGCSGRDPTPAARRLEAEVSALEESTRRSPPAPGGVLFVGSSSIRLWDLEKHFPGLGAINRGFGGSTARDCVEYAGRLVLPLAPRTVVFYAGDNDIAGGASPERVLEDIQEFAAAVHSSLPQARILFISIKPSRARWSLVEEMRRANALIREWTARDPRLGFIDIQGLMIGPDGAPRTDLLAPGGLHLSDEGYRLWSEKVRDALEPVRKGTVPDLNQ